MKKQFLVEIDYEENVPDLVTEVGVEICLDNMMGGYVSGLIKDGWEVNVTEVR